MAVSQYLIGRRVSSRVQAHHIQPQHNQLPVRQKKYLLAAVLLLVFFLNTAYRAPANEEAALKEYLTEANNHIKAYRHFPASDALKEAAKIGGNQYPSLHMRLAILYYGLGLIPDAIAEGEKAVSLAPKSKWYKYDLAKFYLVDKQLDKAERQFITLLKIDPGFTLGYCYLAEVYFKKKQYDMAWLSLTRARHLGHQGKRLLEKLSPLSSKPAENLEDAAGNDKMFRFIILSTGEEAEAVSADIKNGKPFHQLELELPKDIAGAMVFGVFMLSELKDSVAAVLKDSAPYSPPIVIKTGPDFRVVQRIIPFDPQVWQKIVASSPGNLKKAESEEMPSPQPTVLQKPFTARDNSDQGNIQTSGDQTKKDMFSSRLAAFYALENWRNAWEDIDLERYLDAYSMDFIPQENMSLSQWKEERKKSLSRSGQVRISLINPVIEMINESRIVITFKQNYSAENYSDTVIKKLTMRKEGDKWRIIDELAKETVAK